jgi:hypothetical protein
MQTISPVATFQTRIVLSHEELKTLAIWKELKTTQVISDSCPCRDLMQTPVSASQIFSAPSWPPDEINVPSGEYVTHVTHPLLELARHNWRLILPVPFFATYVQVVCVR